ASTDRAFTLVTARGPLARFIRTRLVPLFVPALFQMPPLRRLMFETVSQIGINYRHSALSAGRAGAVRGGDRLPLVETAEGSDNFAPLSSLSWQVHIYGDVRPGVEQACAELGLSLHRFAWTPAMRRAGLRRGAAYLIRPDGYVALAEPHADPGRLRNYWRAKGF
ncbi:MAG: hypothetical protein ACREJM_04580, partial [Candidatus Saccharimonadales bacterium]